MVPPLLSPSTSAGPAPPAQAPHFCPLSLLATLLSLWRDTDTWSPGPWRVLSAVLYLLSVHMCSEGGRCTSAPTDAGLQDEPLALFALTGHLSAWIHPGDLLRVSISLHLESSAL